MSNPDEKMRHFVHRENIARFEKLLEKATDENQRQQIHKLIDRTKQLAQEQGDLGPQKT